jgi:voltage-gated potassium channel
MPETHLSALRHRLAVIFEDDEPRRPATRLFNVLLTTLIVLNVAGIVLESVESIRHHFSAALDAFEKAATVIFAAEYVLRAWACVDFHSVAYRHPVWGRLRYLHSFFALIDLAAVLPALIGTLGAADLRVLRLLRLLRMLKLVRHSTTFNLLGKVLQEEGRSIGALVFVLLLTITIAGSLMFMLESEVQPNVFTSIPVAMWWAVETVTTVGYGDVVPITAMGRLLGGVVSIIGIGTLALFSGLITVGFIDQLKLYREHHPKVSVAAAGDATAPIELPHRDARAAFHHPQAAGDGAGHAAPASSYGVVVPPKKLLPAVCPHCGSALGHLTH